MKLADDDKAAVAQVLTDYYRAFSTLDAEAVKPYFYEPSQLVSPAGVVPTPTRAALAEAVAFVVGGAVGLNTTDATRDYIHLYHGDREALASSLDRPHPLQQLRKHLSGIRTVAEVRQHADGLGVVHRATADQV